jgi:arylsulfatase A-like enzyme
LRALQAVDELVDGVFKKLEDYKILDNTYIIYSSDNGYHIGQHRLQPGKECGYEEDINIPLIIRGPGVAENVTTELVTTHTDLAPTILKLIGEKPRPDFDGSAIPVDKKAIAAAEKQWHEHVNVEYWGFAVSVSRRSKWKIEH